jgi:hypothetical protein
VAIFCLSPLSFLFPLRVFGKKGIPKLDNVKTFMKEKDSKIYFSMVNKMPLPDG